MGPLNITMVEMEIRNQGDVKQVESRSTEDELARQGEALEASEKMLGLWQAIKLHKMALVYMLAAYSCAGVYGYDTIANGASLAMPAFELYFGHFDPIHKVLYLDSIWTSLWTSMSGLGSILGSAAAGPISQWMGRRYTGMSFGGITVIGVALQFVAQSKGLLLAGKMVNGFAIGGLLAVGTTYGSEIVPPRLRGALLAIMAFFEVALQAIGLGVVRAFVPNIAPSAFRTVFALQWLFGAFPIIIFFLVPESPNFLILKGKRQAALDSLTRLYGNNAPARLAHLERGIQHEFESTKEASYLDCFKGVDRKRTFTVMLIMFGTGALGTAFLTLNIYFLVLTGLPVIHCFDINIGGFALALLIMPFSSIISDRFGRRPMYLSGVMGTAIALAVTGGLGYASPLNKAADWALAIILNLLICWQLFTVIFSIWAITPALSSYKLRQHTQSICIMMQAFSSWLFAFVSPYMYNVGKGSGNLGAKTGFVYMGTSIILFAVTYFWVPETQGHTTEEMDYCYENKIPPRKFASVIRQRQIGEKTEVGLESSSSDKS